MPVSDRQPFQRDRKNASREQNRQLAMKPFGDNPRTVLAGSVVVKTKTWREKRRKITQCKKIYIRSTSIPHDITLLLKLPEVPRAKHRRVEPRISCVIPSIWGSGPVVNFTKATPARRSPLEDKTEKKCR